jgi:hypothetical protein
VRRNAADSAIGAIVNVQAAAAVFSRHNFTNFTNHATMQIISIFAVFSAPQQPMKLLCNLRTNSNGQWRGKPWFATVKISGGN